MSFLKEGEGRKSQWRGIREGREEGSQLEEGCKGSELATTVRRIRGVFAKFSCALPYFSRAQYHKDYAVTNFSNALLSQSPTHTMYLFSLISSYSGHQNIEDRYAGRPS